MDRDQDESSIVPFLERPAEFTMQRPNSGRLLEDERDPFRRWTA